MFRWIAEWEGLSELDEKIGSLWAQIYSSEKRVDKIVVAHTGSAALRGRNRRSLNLRTVQVSVSYTCKTLLTSSKRKE